MDLTGYRQISATCMVTLLLLWMRRGFERCGPGRWTCGGWPWHHARAPYERDPHRDLERQLPEGPAREGLLVARTGEARRSSHAGDEAVRRRRTARRVS